MLAGRGSQWNLSFTRPNSSVKISFVFGADHDRGLRAFYDGLTRDGGRAVLLLGVDGAEREAEGRLLVVDDVRLELRRC